MDSNQVTYFLKIVSCGNFSRAAEKLFISQSSLSKRIKALEEELNTELFNRRGNSCSLTESGAIFLKYAQILQQNQMELQNELNIAQSCNIKIRLGSIPIVALPSYGIIATIAEFQSKYLNYNVEYFEKDQESILTSLLNGELDFAILRTESLDQEIFEFFNLITDEFVFVCAKEHPLANEKQISLSNLANEKFLLLEKKSQIYQICRQMFNKHNINPHVIYRNTRHNLIMEMVTKNIGVTIMPKNIACEYKNSLSIIKIDTNPTDTVGLVCKKKNRKLTTHTNNFWNFFIKNFPPH